MPLPRSVIKTDVKLLDSSLVVLREQESSFFARFSLKSSVFLPSFLPLTPFHSSPVFHELRRRKEEKVRNKSGE